MRQPPRPDTRRGFRFRATASAGSSPGAGGFLFEEGGAGGVFGGLVTLCGGFFGAFLPGVDYWSEE
jgi:hypothetical protein